MPTGPDGQKHPADAIGNAVKVMWIATEGEPEDFGSVPNYTFEGLLAGITKENCHDEQFVGHSVGTEFW